MADPQADKAINTISDKEWRELKARASAARGEPTSIAKDWRGHKNYRNRHQN